MFSSGCSEQATQFATIPATLLFQGAVTVGELLEDIKFINNFILRPEINILVN